MYFTILFQGCISHKLLIKSVPQGASVYRAHSLQGPWSRIPNSRVKTPCYITYSDIDSDYLLKVKKYGYQDSEVVPIKNIINKGEYVFKLQPLESNKFYDEFYGKSIFQVNQAGKRKNIGIMDFIAQDRDQEKSFFATEFMQDVLLKTKAFNIVDRRNLGKIVKEIELQQTGLTETEKAIKVGKILNIEEMVIGATGKLGDYNIVSFTVIDIATGRVIYSDSKKFEKDKELFESIVELVNKFIQDRFPQ